MNSRKEGRMQGRKEGGRIKRRKERKGELKGGERGEGYGSQDRKKGSGGVVVERTEMANQQVVRNKPEILPFKLAHILVTL